MSRASPAVRAIAAIAERMTRGMEDHATARQLQAEINRLRSGAEALDNVRRNRSPLDTPEAHTLKVGNLARKFDREITASMNRSGQIIRAGLEDVQSRIDQKVNLKPDAFAAEIRAAFRTLNGEGKAELVQELVEGNRGPELAAIVKAPSVLTGISDEQRAQYEQTIIARHAAAEVDEIEKLNEVLEAALTAQRAAGNLVEAFTNPQLLAEIQRGADAADAASDAFNQSLQ